MRLRRICWLALALAALTLYLFMNTGASLGLLLALVLPPLLSGLELLLRRGSVSAELLLPASCERGTVCSCALRLSVTGGSGMGLTGSLAADNRWTGETVTIPVSLRLRRGVAEELPFALTPAHCGAMELRLTDCRQMDFLHLFSRPLSLACSGRITVLPKPMAVEARLTEAADLPRDSLSYSAQKPGYDPSETFRIRDYVPGDSLRQIHWKLSGKADRLLVRDLGLPIMEQVLLLFNSGKLPDRSDADVMDGLLDLMSGVSLSLLRQNVAHTLAWVDGDGRLVASDVEDPVSMGAALESLLAADSRLSPISAVQALLAAVPERVFAHIGVLTPVRDPALEDLSGRGCVTALCWRGEAGNGLSDRIHVLCVDDTTQNLEL